MPAWRYGRTPRAVTGMVSASRSVSRLPTNSSWRWPQHCRGQSIGSSSFDQAGLAQDRNLVRDEASVRPEGKPITPAPVRPRVSAVPRPK